MSEWTDKVDRAANDPELIEKCQKLTPAFFISRTARTATHEDWQAAKERREDMAIRAARALLADDIAIARRYAIAYDAADTDMHRIGQELDGGQ